MKLLATRVLVGVLLALAAIRIASLGLYPLGDATEARYAEVARLMAASGDWITPQSDPGVALSAKPPLSFWTQAATIKLLGVNEFAARFSSVLFALATLALLWLLARRAEPSHSRLEAWIALVAFATMPLAFIAAGAVMTDMALTAMTTAAMVAFWFAWTQQSNIAGYAFFAALGLVLLAEGPVGVFLVAASVGMFWLIEPDRIGNLKRLWSRLPWIGGVLLMLAIAGPWYVAAELRTPGLLRYFVMGEHVSHVEPRGKIWYFYAGSVLTWLPLLAGLAWSRLRARATLPRWTSFDRHLLGWALATPIFFTLVGNVAWPYALPALPALALLIARGCTRRLEHHAGAPVRWAVPATGILATVAFAVAFLGVIPGQWEDRSTRALIEAKSRTESQPGAPLLVVGSPPHSAKFYTRARYERATIEQALSALERPGEAFVLIDRREVVPALGSATEEVAGTHRYLLLRERRR